MGKRKEKKTDNTQHTSDRIKNKKIVVELRAALNIYGLSSVIPITLHGVVFFLLGFPPSDGTTIIITLDTSPSEEMPHGDQRN